MQKVAFANQFAPGEGDNNSLGVRRQFTLNHVIRAIQGKEPGGRPPMDQKGAHIKFHKDEGTLVKTQDGACIWADENKETLLHYLGPASPRVPHGTDVQVLLEVLKGTSVVQVRVDNGCEDFRGFGYMQSMPMAGGRGMPARAMFPGQVPGMPGQMPGYMGQPGMQQMVGGPRGGGRGGPRGGRGGRGGKGPQGAGPQGGPQGFAYTNGARNQQMGGNPQMLQQMPQMGMPMPMPQPPANEPLNTAMLAQVSESEQKNMIGERLYPLIQREKPELAGKITGMLLEMDNSELVHLLESPDALNLKIQEALQVLQDHASQG
jgi:hypothetical protein